MKSITTRVGIAAAVIFALAAPAGAGASANRVQARPISGESPFVEACTPESTRAGRRHMEQEPSLAVNPTDANNRVVAWIQDWHDGIVVGVTRDGGETWRTIVPPNYNFCTGGAGFNSAINPHLAFAPDGTLYLSANVAHQCVPTAGCAPTFGISVTTSKDGGLTWSAPRLLAQAVFPEGMLDWSWVVPDPVQPGTAYVSWLDMEFEGFALTRVAMMLSRTTDGGATWTPPHEISPTPRGLMRGPSRIVALADGTLVNVFNQLEIGSTDMTVLSTRSLDGGKSWSEPVEIARGLRFPGSDDPNISKLDTPQANLPALGPDGTIHLAWSEFAPYGPDGLNRVFITHSADGGRTWSKAKVAMSSKAPLMNPNLAVAPDGALGLFFYDFRDDAGGDAELTADAWLAISRNGRSWVETHLARFDASSIPPGQDDDIGSYQGMAGTAEGFVTAFTAARPLATAGPTDILYAEVSA